MKRELFYIIGKINKFLCEELDAEDANYFNLEIDKLYIESNKMIHRLEKRNVIMKLTKLIVSKILKFFKDLLLRSKQFNDRVDVNLRFFE